MDKSPRPVFKAPAKNPDFKEIEKRILGFWADTRAFEELIEKNSSGPRYSFIDGPITANNPMGVHHAWGRSYKDIFQRYKAMQGYQQRFQNGFECQGLWVEVEVERDLGLNSKKEIEAFGLDRFARACRDRVSRFAARITDQSIRLGMWMDWENSYYTYSDENIEHISIEVASDKSVALRIGDQSSYTFDSIDKVHDMLKDFIACLLYTSPSPRD